MDGDSYKVDDNEPTFDVDEWLAELTADDQGDTGNVGEEAAGASLLFVNANEGGNEEKTDEQLWPKTQSKSDLFSGLCQTPMLTTSNSDNFSGLAVMGMFPTTPMIKSCLSAMQFPQLTASGLELSQGDSVFQPSPNQSSFNYQIRKEPLQFDHLQSSQQYMSTKKQKTSEIWKVSNPSTSRPPGFFFPDSDVSIKPAMMTSQQNLQQQVRRPMQFYHHLGAQHLHGMQQTMHGTSLSHGLIGGQLRPNQFPQGSSGVFNNLAQNGVLFPHLDGWQDHAFNQLLTMKRLYLAEVMSIYQRYWDLSTVQAPSAGHAIRVEKARMFVEKIIRFLNISKNDIVHCSKDKVYNYMNQITNFIYQNRSKLSVPSQYHQPIGQPHRLPQNRNIKIPDYGSAAINRFVTGPENPNARVGFSAMTHDRFNLGVPALLQPCSTGLSHPNALSAALMNPSPNSMSGTYGSVTQPNMMKQPHQPSIDEYKQYMMGFRMAGNADLRSGESMSSGTTMFEQPCKEKSLDIDQFLQAVLSPESCQPNVAPPQSGQSSSPQVDSNELSSKVSSGSTSSQSVVPSPLTTLTPSAPSLVDHVKRSSSHSPSSTSGEDSRAENEPQAPENSGVPDMIEVEKSNLTTQTESEEVQNPNVEIGPFERLLEVVKSSSPKALKSALQDIGAVTNLIDRRAGAVLVDESRYLINRDLADEIQKYSKDNDLLILEHEVSKWPSSAFESFVCLSGENFDTEPIASPESKRSKIEVDDLLMKEIKELNMDLLETVVEVVMDKTEGGEETIIHCSYFPVGQFAIEHAEFPSLQLRLLVNRDYPHSSPSVLDVIHHNYSETEEVQAITHKAKSKFNISLRDFSEPMSLSAMVKAWDVTARGVYHECAEKLGGECFSSVYGGWNDCVAAV